MDHPSPRFLSFISDELARRDGPLDVLEVGGGAVCRVPVPNARYVVLDASPDALERNSLARETLHGDAQSFDYGDRRFDMVIFWNVLEHVADPATAIRRAAATLREGGLLIVRGPTLDSLKALVTRYTPHAVHVAFYRRVSGLMDAGKPGFAPFPVEHKASSAPERIGALLATLGLKLAFADYYVGNQVDDLRRYSPLAYRAYSAAEAIVARLSRRRYGRRETEFVEVWAKETAFPGPAASSTPGPVDHRGAGIGDEQIRTLA